jgi:hypothetical protein
MPIEARANDHEAHATEFDARQAAQDGAAA